MPRARPASRQVDPQGIQAFLDAVAADGLELHGLMVFRAGAVVAEGYWAPYAAPRPHMLHSAVKSWTAAAVGLAVADGLLTLEDKVVGFFPEHCPSEISPNLAAMTIEDLLTMRSGHATGISGGEWRSLRESWVAAFLQEPVPFRPGEEFIYSSGSSYMLSAIVSRVTGRRIHAYLAERIFHPIGAGPGSWDLSPEGYNPGGNGLSCTLEDMLKFGVLHLQDGVWAGQRLLPEGWVARATRNHVREAWMAPLDGKRFIARDAMPAAAVERREGYGYQWWMTADGGYRASGLFGQQCIVLPRHDAVIAVTAGLPTPEPRLLAHLWQHVVPALGRAAPGAGATEDALFDRLGRLALPLPAGTARSPVQAMIGGRRFAMAPNEAGVTAVAFAFAGDRCDVMLEDARGVHRITAGFGAPVEGETTMSGAMLHHAYEPDRLRVVASATWLDAHRLCMTWRFVETAFCDTVTCHFDGQALRLERRVNTNAGLTALPPIAGAMA
ncbi:MAG TPA: serine hydrolase [Roseomonas sp.]